MRLWIIMAVLAVVLGAGGVLALALQGPPSPRRAEQARVPHRPAHVDHSALINARFADGDGPAVTKVCLGCHPQAASEVMATSHWTWLGPRVTVPGHDQPVQIGKKNLINNFCIAVSPNLVGCTSCHAGYGWKDASFDFTDATRIDCLVCHETTGNYRKGKAGIAETGVDLLASARSVGIPTRRNCGYCHFAGGGGDAVKHGDLDGTMFLPNGRIDAHMGKQNMLCIDCHRTQHHAIAGRSISVSVDDRGGISCADCHGQAPHHEDRLNAHTKAVACQTCHIPEMAVESPTKMTWDWSTAGKDIPDADPHEYLKIKGSFTYARNVVPEYAWFNGHARRYLAGDRIDPARTTQINYPLGSISDPAARIWPFKVHRGKQPYDMENNYLLVPKTVGEGGYWTDFDWDKAFRLGEQASGLQYSGKYAFAPTEMWWPLSHMVATKDKALQCVDCHQPGGRMNWAALGYEGDPAFHGGREQTVTMTAPKEDQ